jgi:hypothetical protein
VQAHLSQIVQHPYGHYTSSVIFLVERLADETFVRLRGYREDSKSERLPVTIW